jgi:hypothetical protein
VSPERLHIIVRRDPADQRSPLEAIDQVNSSQRPTASGNIAYASDPIAGLDRHLEPVLELACGVIVLSLTPLEAEIFAEQFPNLEVGEEVYLRLADSWGYEDEFADPAAPTLWKATFVVRDAHDRPVPGAKVLARVPGLQAVIMARTNETGEATLNVPRTDASFSVQPAHSYWDRQLGRLAPRDFLRPLEVSLQALTFEPGHQWDMRTTGMHEVPAVSVDSPVRVAVIDTGVADHPNLPRVARRKNFVSGEPPLDKSQFDPRGHGTALAGIIFGGRAEDGIQGYVPGAELWDLRVVPSVGPASEITVATAITEAVQEGAEVICLALATSSEGREPIALREALRFAGEKGVICCISAGNDGAAVSWPAAFNFPHCLSVGAFGRLDTTPSGTTHELAIPDFPRTGGFFFASFSNRALRRGRVDVVAPGVACVTTAPGGYAAFSGTSIAAAHAAGFVGVMLERYPKTRAAGWQDAAEAVVHRVVQTAQPFGWGREREGAGRLAFR